MRVVGKGWKELGEDGGEGGREGGVGNLGW